MRTILFIFFLLSALFCDGQVLQQRAVRLMGSRFDITIVANDTAAADAYIDTVVAEVTRIENLISDWSPQTQISEVNRNAGIKAVKVDREVFDLTQRALYLSSVTNGAFDISFAAMDRIWKFDGSMKEMPSVEAIARSVKKIGYRNILLNKEESTIFLRNEGMKIGFGALGEGYAADKCRKMMIAKGVKAGIVNGSGDMNSWGRHPTGDAWKIGVTNPVDDNELFIILPLEEEAAVTSGTYEKYVVFKGKRYAHIINPKTGYPAFGLSSVTILGPSAEFANGLSTSIMVLGKKKGLRLLKSYPKYRGIFVDDKGRVTATKNLGINLAERID